MSNFRQNSLYDNSGKRKYINEKERKRFLKVILNKPIYEALFFQMLLMTGARISEVLSLTSDSFDMDEKLVSIECLKKRKRGIFRQIPLPDHILKTISNIVEGKESNEVIWKWSRRTATRRIKQAMIESKIHGPQSSSKGLRHGYAVLCLQKRVPLTLIQIWMGHSSIQTTSIYLQVSGEEERKFAEKIWQ